MSTGEIETAEVEPEDEKTHEDAGKTVVSWFVENLCDIDFKAVKNIWFRIDKRAVLLSAVLVLLFLWPLEEALFGVWGDLVPALFVGWYIPYVAAFWYIPFYCLLLPFGRHAFFERIILGVGLCGLFFVWRFVTMMISVLFMDLEGKGF